MPHHDNIPPQLYPRFKLPHLPRLSFFTTDQVTNLSLVKLDATVKLLNHTY